MKSRQSFSKYSSSFEGVGILAIVLVLHFAFLACYFAPAISTPDANGYLAQARLIAEEGRSDIVVESPAQYVGDHWMRVSEGRYFGQYPPGLPLILAVVYRALGAYASLWIIPIMGTLTLAAVFLVTRAWLGSDWALLATILMAVNPFANAHALGADSHTAVCFFLMWGLFGLVMWEQHRRWWWAVLCGFCLGVIPSIRYAEAIFLVAVAVYVLSIWKRQDGYGSLLAGAIAALVPLSALAIRNQHAFGAFWKTGYSISGEQTGFGIGYFLRYSIPYLALVLGIGSFVLLPLGIRGMMTLWRRPETRRRAQLLAGLMLPITVLYMSYYWPPGHNSMRFLLPTFYLYAIASVWFLALRTEQASASGRKLTVIVAVLVVLWGIPLTVFELRRLKHENATLAMITNELQSRVEPGSILIAQNGLQQHLDFVGGWKLAPEEAFDRAPRPERPMGPGGFEPADFADVGDELTPLERSQQFREAIAKWSRGRKVYWLTGEAKLQEVAERLGNDDEFKVIDEIEIGGRFNVPPFEAEGPPEGFEDRRGPPQGRPRGSFGFGGQPPPRPPRDGLRGPGGPGGHGPPRFHPPAGGKFLLVEWQPVIQ